MSVAVRRALWVAAVALALVAACFSDAASTTKHGHRDCDGSVMQSSGYIDVPGIGSTKKHVFYWLFAPRNFPTDGSEPPVMLWMTGGPGCSSGLALLAELGPCMMNESSGELYYNPYGWNDNAYLLFVDQPAGVGYSYADKINWDHNESEIADDMYNFLQAFAKKFTTPSITGKNDFYVIGESYGGHYVPSVGYRILQGNLNGDGPHINLKAISIGNGITDPYTQYPAYVEFAYDFCNEKLGQPCINDTIRDEMRALLPACLDATYRCNQGKTDSEDDSCVEALEKCNAYYSKIDVTGLNIYDLRKPCVGNLCYGLDHTTAFFERAEVKNEVGAKADKTWATCNGEVGELFVRDQQRNFNWTIPPLLAAGIPVTLYAGEMDYACNWIGNKRWALALNWPGKAGFNAAQDVPFSVGGRVAGTERRYGNFTFLRIFDAGHMVPMDQPEVSLYLVHQFLKHESLAA